jgi:hypothetical protein
MKRIRWLLFALMLASSALAGDAGVKTMSSDELLTKAKAFARDGGGHLFVVAVSLESNRADYGFGHWAGFFTTASLSTREVVRPSPPYLLVCNHPVSRESQNQDSVEELVRWEPDGSLVSTGIIYAKWGGPGRDSAAFTAAALRLLKKK